jgi:hypothetical protein
MAAMIASSSERMASGSHWFGLFAGELFEYNLLQQLALLLVLLMAIAPHLWMRSLYILVLVGYTKGL